jgi:hypothetical protein
LLRSEDVNKCAELVARDGTNRIPWGNSLTPTIERWLTCARFCGREEDREVAANIVVGPSWIPVLVGCAKSI